MYLNDQKNPENKLLEFQSDEAEERFMDTIPQYIKDKQANKEEFEFNAITTEKVSFEVKLEQIY